MGRKTTYVIFIQLIIPIFCFLTHREQKIQDEYEEGASSEMIVKRGHEVTRSKTYPNAKLFTTDP